MNDRLFLKKTLTDSWSSFYFKIHFVMKCHNLLYALPLSLLPVTCMLGVQFVFSFISQKALWNPLRFGMNLFYLLGVVRDHSEVRGKSQHFT